MSLSSSFQVSSWNDIWNQIKLPVVYGSSTYWYVLVSTAFKLYSSQHVPVRTLGKFLHDCTVTYEYMPASTGIAKIQKVCTSTYKYVLFMENNCLWSLYMPAWVHDSTLQYTYQFSLVHTGSYWYVRLSTNCMSVLLDLRQHFCCTVRQKSAVLAACADGYPNACINWFINEAGDNRCCCSGSQLESLSVAACARQSRRRPPQLAGKHDSAWYCPGVSDTPWLH
jgi:hypothetical protein